MTSHVGIERHGNPAWFALHEAAVNDLSARVEAHKRACAAADRRIAALQAEWEAR